MLLVFLLLIAAISSASAAAASCPVEKYCIQQQDKASKILAFLSRNGQVEAAMCCSVAALSKWPKSSNIWKASKAIVGSKGEHFKLNRVLNALDGFAATESNNFDFLTDDSYYGVNPSMCADEDTQLEVLGNYIRVSGYQNYVVNRRHLELNESDHRLNVKSSLVKEFVPTIFKNKRVVDLGANAGYFTLLSMMMGAAHVQSVETSPRYSELVQEVGTLLGYSESVTVLQSSLIDLASTEQGIVPGDISLAFALIHWLYTANSKLGSIAAVVAELAETTKDALIVEWIEVDKGTILPQWKPNNMIGPYDHKSFLEELSNHFNHIQLLGMTMPVRRVYLAYGKKKHRSVDRDLVQWFLNIEPPLLVYRVELFQSYTFVREAVVAHPLSATEAQLSKLVMRDLEIHGKDIEPLLAARLALYSAVLKATKPTPEIISAFNTLKSNPCISTADDVKLCFKNIWRFAIEGTALRWSKLGV